MVIYLNLHSLYSNKTYNNSEVTRAFLTFTHFVIYKTIKLFFLYLPILYFAGRTVVSMLSAFFLPTMLR